MLLLQVGFQKILMLTYVDKLIDDIQLHFRDRYKNELEQKGAIKYLVNDFEFGDDFDQLLRWVMPGFFHFTKGEIAAFTHSLVGWSQGENN